MRSCSRAKTALATCRSAVLAATVLCTGTVWAQRGGREPHIGYLYPAGGQQDTVFEVLAGGQNLRSPEGVHVTGEGVGASVIEYVPALPLNQRGKAGRHIRELVKLRTAQRAAQRKGTDPPDPAETEKKRAEFDPVPDHPWLRGLDEMSLVELLDLTAMLFDKKAQQNSQLAEGALIEVSIHRDATPGDRELRVVTRNGMTNPMVFQVGTLPEACEQEPNDPRPQPAWPPVKRPEQPVHDLPVLLNGQIMPGDVDRFRIWAAQGQRLVIEAQARHLVPYLADAVPGWFQATLALYDSDGCELAYADDYRFNPDPVLYCEIPKNGEYQLEIRDAIYRGREDFVYRVSVGEQPFITWMFPLGGPAGTETMASVGGWHLPRDEVSLNTRPGAERIRSAEWPCPQGVCNRVLYAVDTLPECTETEPNDTAGEAQRVTLPEIINGRITGEGDKDVFGFQGHAGDEVVVEVMARRLNSPLDSLVRLTDGFGAVLAFNDDHMEKDGHLHTGPGLLTHHADSYLRARLPADGVYCVQVADVRGQGSEAHAYRLHIRPATPDFALRVTPSSLAVPAGRSAEICVHALRTDGFEGEIEVAVKGGPEGFVAHGARIPAGRDSIRMTLTAPPKPVDGPASLQLAGSALVDGQTVSRPALPAENVMQAFLWRHLVPSQEMVVAVAGARRSVPTFEVTDALPVQIPLDGTVQVAVAAVGRKMPDKVRFQLSQPPDGLTLREVTAGNDGATLVLHADDSALEAGYADNLIVEASVDVERKTQDGKTRKWRVPLGVLPAVPFKIVAP